MRRGHVMMLCRVGVSGFWPSHLAMCEHETTAGTRIGVPILFQLISVASLARIGNQSLCPVLKPFGSGFITHKQTHKHTNKQTNTQTNKQTNTQTNKETNKERNKQTNKHTQPTN